jgi:hypothetical protein
LGKCNYKHEGIEYDGEDCPLCPVLGDVVRLKKELGEKQYFETLVRLDREIYERLMCASNLYGPAEGLNAVLILAIRLGLENLIVNLEEKGK